MEAQSEQRRRTGERKARLGGRSERVVRDVLKAVAVELAQTGYVALRVEDVAARANVNKTTIYRRWSTKADLVGAMLRLMREDAGDPPDTGSLRLDLVELLKGWVARSSTPEGYGLSRVIMAEMDHPEVGALVRVHREEHQAVWKAAIARAVERGELPKRSDPRLIIEPIHGAVMTKLFRLREPVDDDYLAAIVNLVVLGAEAGGAIRKASR